MKNYWLQIFTRPQTTIQHILEFNPNYAKNFLVFIYGLYFLGTFTRSTHDEMLKELLKDNADIAVKLPSYETSLLLGLFLCWPIGWLFSYFSASIYTILCRIIKNPTSNETCRTTVLWGAYAMLPSFLMCIAFNIYYVHEWSLTYSTPATIFYLTGLLGVFIFILMFKQAAGLSNKATVAVGVTGVILETLSSILFTFVYVLVLVLFLGLLTTVW
jgi:hypothetical protein